MLEHQYYALAACLVLFAAALAYSAKSAREYHIWYKKEKEEAKDKRSSVQERVFHFVSLDKVRENFPYIV